MDILYRRNTFSFTGDYGIPTALIFLRDRPTASLHLIRSLELRLKYVEELQPSGVTSERYSGRHVLLRKHASEFYEELCSVLSPPQMDLRRLYLTVDTHWTHPLLDADGPALRQRDNLKWQHSTRNRSPDIVEWVHPLLNVKGLEKLSVYWINGIHTRLVGQTIALMAEKMLKDRSRWGNDQERLEENKLEFLYRTVHKNHPASCAAVIFDPYDQSVSGRQCTIHDDGERLTEVPDENIYKFDSRSEQRLVQEHLDACPVCLTCYWESPAS